MTWPDQLAFYNFPLGEREGEKRVLRMPISLPPISAGLRPGLGLAFLMYTSQKIFSSWVFFTGRVGGGGGKMFVGKRGPTRFGTYCHEGGTKNEKSLI